MDTINLTESSRLVQLESVIETGRSTFLEVGAALLEIRDRRLYRVEHNTFAAYCRERWWFGKSQAYRLIQAAVEYEMSPMGDKPKTEREARKRRCGRKKASDLTLDAHTGASASEDAGVNRQEGGDEEPDAGHDSDPPRVHSAAEAPEPEKPFRPEFDAIVRAIEIMREEELALTSASDLQLLAGEHEETARQLREKAERL